MQNKKENIKQKIIKSAKQEFLEKGFENSSIRSIATAANISKSNIYNYFANKDDLFGKIVIPTIEKIYSSIDKKIFEYKNGDKNIYLKENQKKFIINIIKFYCKIRKNYLSNFFISSLGDFYIDIISKLLLENKSLEEMRLYNEEFLTFIYGGWSQLLK